MLKKHNQYNSVFKKTMLAAAVSSVLTMGVATPSYAAEGAIEEVVITGIRGSLKRAIDVKRDASGVVDSIAAEDLGKFPDLNVAESLQRISGVSIDRSGGEGQQVSVRGFGPQFNTVLVNGRQIATDSSGREFNFDVLAAEQISGADIYKTGNANLQEGGIGSTINVKTFKPFDNRGLQLLGSVKGVYESLSEKTSPAVSGLISNTFADDTFGVSLAVSHQERDVQINRIETVGWRPGLTLTNNAGDDDPTTLVRENPDTIETIATNVYLPRNWDQIVDQQERTRTNANLVVQYAPSDDLTLSFDAYMSKFEVDSLVTDLASWFEPDRVGSATIDANGTAIAFTQVQGLDVSSGAPRTDLVQHTRNGRDTKNNGIGINAEYQFNDNLSGVFDISGSEAENDQAGRNRFNVIGIDNNYSFDGTGSLPVVTHDGFGNGNRLPASSANAHYNERNGFTDDDKIQEFKADFEYVTDSGVFQKMKFGAYSQSREKERFQLFTNAGCAFCGYNLPIPVSTGLLQEFSASNFFSGLITDFYSYDGEAYFRFLEDPANGLLQDTILDAIATELGEDPVPQGSTAAALGAGFIPVLQDNRYKVDEDITSLYVDFDFASEIGDMPVEVNFGARYSETDVSVAAIQSELTDIIPTSDLTLFQNVLSNPTPITQKSSYSNLLPSLNVKLDLNDDMVLRFSRYDSLTRPTLSQLSPATVYGQPRRQNLTAAGGNPNLKPFKAENWDLSFEWYYGDSSNFSAAFFNKEVEDFIITLTGDEVITLSDRAGTSAGTVDNICAVAACSLPSSLANEELNGITEVYSVTRPQNGESATVNGYELAWTHVWDNGFGVTANGTFVDSDAKLSSDTSQTFALEGLGDSQNLIGFYENDVWQARIAFNNREGFLRALDNGGTGEPINTAGFGQIDISASYNYNDNLTVFFEGINITEEELRQNGRFANQAYNIEDNGSRYAIGIRGKW